MRDHIRICAKKELNDFWTFFADEFIGGCAEVVFEFSRFCVHRAFQVNAVLVVLPVVRLVWCPREEVLCITFGMSLTFNMMIIFCISRVVFSEFLSNEKLFVGDEL